MKGRKIFQGSVEREVLKSEEPISFYGGVDPDTGVVAEKGHPLEGKSVKDKILVFPTGKGSTVGSYTLYRLKKNGVAPKAVTKVRKYHTTSTITAIYNHSEFLLSNNLCVDKLQFFNGLKMIFYCIIVCFYLTKSVPRGKLKIARRSNPSHLITLFRI